MVSGGVAHVLEIIMFTPSTNTFLCRDCTQVRPLLEPQKSLLELIHSGVGKQERGVVGGNQRTGLHTRVALRLKVAEECFADICGFHGVVSD